MDGDSYEPANTQSKGIVPGISDNSFENLTKAAEKTYRSISTIWLLQQVNLGNSPSSGKVSYK